MDGYHTWTHKQNATHTYTHAPQSNPTSNLCKECRWMKDVRVRVRACVRWWISPIGPYTWCNFPAPSAALLAVCSGEHTFLMRGHEDHASRARILCRLWRNQCCLSRSSGGGRCRARRDAGGKGVNNGGWGRRRTAAGCVGCCCCSVGIEFSCARLESPSYIRPNPYHHRASA